MRLLLILILHILLIGCVGSGGGEAIVAYEVFVANVDRIIVNKEVNVAEPIRIGIDGHFEDDCSEFAHIAIEKSDSPNNIELTVYGKRRLNSKCNSKRVIYFGSITITGLSEGRYRIRINGNNNLVEYFSVVRGDTRDASSGTDAGSDCVDEIANVSMADITVDGFNSAKNTKIPYGTPISVIVKGTIIGPCRSFKGFDYDKLGNYLYLDVIAEYCPLSCFAENEEYNETYVISGLLKGKYKLYINNYIEIPFEIVD
ncbi:MAG: hypothetical protein N2746_02210 [Deltaproteobacteria bacterium]|nr:hypothetical protein [Deltaproteobacteria bacterium]